MTDPVAARTKYPASFKNPWSTPGVVGNTTQLTTEAVSIDNKLTAAGCIQISVIFLHSRRSAQPPGRREE